MHTPFDIYQQRLEELTQQSLRRDLSTIEYEGIWLKKEGQMLLSFSGNDYLGLSQHQQVIDAAQQALQCYGVGAGSSRYVSGNHPYYSVLEQQLSRYKKTDAALIFGSGYLANIGVIGALATEKDVIIADKLIHASLLDGVKQSGAKLYRYRHNDMAHLTHLLQQHRQDYGQCLVITETIFSMDGDKSPMQEILNLCKRFDALLLSDDAHGLGVIKPNIERSPYHIQLGTLSKALGCYGGYVAASQDIIDYIANKARSLIYQTALPPSIVAAAAKALEIIEHNPELGQKLLAHAQYFTEIMQLPHAESAIVPVIIGGNEEVVQLSQHIADEGFHVGAIRPPTVPANTARLRITFSVNHQREMIEKLASVINKYRGGIGD